MDNCYMFFFICIIAMLSWSILSQQNEKNKIKGKKLGKTSEAFLALIEKATVSEMMVKNLMSMVDNIDGLAIWMKDDQDRYMYADKSLRKMLFNNVDMVDMLGKTDAELNGIPCRHTDYDELVDILRDIQPEDLPKIPPKFFDKSIICNLTDVITREFKKPCRFHEVVAGKILDVWKTSIVDEVTGEVIATVGALIDITHQKYDRIDQLQYMMSVGQAHRIDSTSNYYLERYEFGSLNPKEC